MGLFFMPSLCHPERAKDLDDIHFMLAIIEHFSFFFVSLEYYRNNYERFRMVCEMEMGGYSLGYPACHGIIDASLKIIARISVFFQN